MQIERRFTKPRSYRAIRVSKWEVRRMSTSGVLRKYQRWKINEIWNSSTIYASGPSFPEFFPSILLTSYTIFFSAYPNSNGFFSLTVIPGDYVLCAKYGNKFFKKQNVTVHPEKTFSVSIRSYGNNVTHATNVTCYFDQPIDSSADIITLNKNLFFIKLFVIITFIYTLYWFVYV